MNCDDDGALWWWWCTVMIIIAVMMMMHCGDYHAMWSCTVMIIMMIHCDDDDAMWWWTVMMMMHCDDDNARWWYWIYHIYSVSLSISRTFLAQFGLVSCGSQRRKIPRFLGHCTPAWLPQEFRRGTCLSKWWYFCNKKVCILLLKDFQRKSLWSNEKTPFVFGLEIFVTDWYS